MRVTSEVALPASERKLRSHNRAHDDLRCITIKYIHKYIYTEAHDLKRDGMTQLTYCIVD